MAADIPSYFWAYEREIDGLSPDAEAGLEYASRLAKNARERSRGAFSGTAPAWLTAEDIGIEEGLLTSTVLERIALARFEIVGTLSDSAIYYRLARWQKLLERPERYCKAPDCENAVPGLSTQRREYCHARCRRRHHYQRTHQQARPLPKLRGMRRGRTETAQAFFARSQPVIASVIASGRVPFGPEEQFQLARRIRQGRLALEAKEARREAEEARRAAEATAEAVQADVDAFTDEGYEPLDEAMWS